MSDKEERKRETTDLCIQNLGKNTTPPKQRIKLFDDALTIIEKMGG